ncbi:hypothetical protein [Ilumatobacter coccineus]|nr:hypothetical protein [Ilumatobacter coccineus]
MSARMLALMLAATSITVVSTSSPAQATTLTASNGAGLRAAIDQANSDSTVDLIEVTATNVVLGAGGDVCNDPPFGIDLDDANASGDLDFTGSQDLTIRGTASDRSYLIQNCADRVIDHHGSGTLTLEHLRMEGTIPSVPIGSGADPADYSGGSVRSVGGSLDIVDSLFQNSAAGSADASISGFGSAQTPGSGGAIHAEGDITVSDSEFIDNVAGRGGDGDASIAATHGGSGGAIHAPVGTLTVTDTSFSGNQAGNGGNSDDLPAAHGGPGGAIHGNIVMLDGVSFYLERAGTGGDSDDNRGGDGGGGGAVRAETSVSATRTSFNTVLAGYGGTGNADGGAVTPGSQGVGGPGGNGGAISAPHVDLDASFITEGYAGFGGTSTSDQGGEGGDGGGIFAVSVSVTDSEIEGSFAGDGGYNAPASPTANGGNGGDGGAVAAQVSIASSGSYFESNEAGIGGTGTSGGLGGDGGAFAGASGSTVTMTIVDSVFDDNGSGSGGVGSGDVRNAAGRGGAVFNNNNANRAVDVTNSTFVRNRIGDGPDSVSTGSAIAANNMTLTLTTVTDNVGTHALEWTGTGLAGFDFITASVIGDNVGGNCAPSTAPRQFFTQSGGYNVEDGDSCGFDAATDLVDQADLGLDPISAGPSPIVDPGLDPDGVGRVPTVDGLLDGLIPVATCISGFRLDVVTTDQWANLRPGGAGCEPGALEIGVPADPDPDPDPDPAGQLDDAARFVPVAPVRLFDTRDDEPAAGPKGLVAPDSSIDVQITGVGGVPNDAVAVVMNVAAINATNGGFVTIWATGQPQPLAATHNLTAPGQTRPNLVTVPIGAGGKVSIYTQRGAHFAGDVAGYYDDVDVATSAGRVVSVQPARLFDTRPTETESPGPKGVLGAGDTIDVQVTGVAGVPPTGVSAVVMNLAGINATGKGFVTAFPAGDDRPLAAVLNLNAAGETNSNLVMLPVGADGKVSLYSSGGTHLSGDVTAYVTDSSAGAGTLGLFVPLDPTRAFDTRPSETDSAGPKGFVAADSSIDGGLGIEVGIPSTASGAVLNVAGVAAAGKGFVTGYPAGTERPLSATLNLAGAGDVRPNAAILPIGTGDDISFYSQSGTHLVVDTSGYFLG